MKEETLYEAYIKATKEYWETHNRLVCDNPSITAKELYAHTDHQQAAKNIGAAYHNWLAAYKQK